ncbi:MAG: ATP-binding protein, partial [Acidobacteriota bacterium]
QERLETKFVISDETLDALVPNMLLQPLVENSIKHNDLRSSNRYYIEIVARKNNERLMLDIIDNGPGILADRETVLKNGIGLSNIVARLKQLYGEEGKIEFTNHTDRGLSITIDIPFEHREYTEVEHEIASTSHR